MRLGNLSSYIKNIITDAVKIITTKNGLKGLYRVSLYRNAVYLMINSAALALSGFFFWIVAARFYPVESVGIASAAIGAAGLLVLFSSLGLDHGIIRFLPGAGDKTRDMINSCLSLLGVISLILTVIFLIGINIWSPALLTMSKNLVFITVFMLFTTASTLQNFVNQVFIAKRRAGFALLQGLIFGLLRFIPLFLLVSLFQTFGIFVSLGIAVFIAIVTSTLISIPRIEKGYLPLPVIRKQIIKEMVNYSFANYITGILWMLPQTVMPLMVINLLGAEQNAYYYIGWSVASMLFMIPMAVSFSLFAEGSHNEEKLDVEIMRGLKLLSVILIPAIIILAIFAEKILSFFGPAYSANATKLTWILIFSAIPLSINYIYYGIKRVEMKMKTVIILAAFISCVTLGLSYLLLPRMGIIGVGVAWLSSHSTVAVFVVFSLLRHH